MFAFDRSLLEHDYHVVFRDGELTIRPDGPAKTPHALLEAVRNAKPKIIAHLEAVAPCVDCEDDTRVTSISLFPNAFCDRCKKLLKPKVTKNL